MRLYTKKLLQVLLAVFLIFVIYLNLNMTDLSSDSQRVNTGPLPWGGDFQKGKPPRSSVIGNKIHDHVLRPNASKPGHGTRSAASRAGDVYPSLEYDYDDRILKQLKLTPATLPQQAHVKPADGEAVVGDGGGVAAGVEAPSLTKNPKKILVYSGTGSWHIPRGGKIFQDQQCGVRSCELVDDRTKIKDADVVLFQHAPPPSGSSRPPNQIWALFMLESPYHTPSYANSRDAFNWTATYRHDSTIVAPYEKYVPLNDSLLTRAPLRNYALGKGKKVAWFVSNCGARNGRQRYAAELGKHIDVDIYGGCGTLSCPRHQSEKCFDMLNTDYKFYLAFENSNCRDYITEKFFINGLKHDVIPVVMGAAPEDYRRAAPPHSFIHVDDFASAQDLAAYLHKLDGDDALYNAYFAWKGLWDNINTFFWCRMCSMAHMVNTTPSQPRAWYKDVDTWWRGGDVCIGQNTWRQSPPKRTLIADLAVVESGSSQSHSHPGDPQT